MEKGFSLKVDDWYNLHKGFTLTLQPGYTVLVGPNGAGKTTLLAQIEEEAKKRNYKVLRYGDKENGGKHILQKSVSDGDCFKFASLSTCSEGELMAEAFGDMARLIGDTVRDAKKRNIPLFILLDSLDSGTSIDRQRQMMDLFHLIEEDIGVGTGNSEHDIYIINAANSFEIVQGERAIDVRTGQLCEFKNYRQYSNWICSYFKKHSPPKKKPGKTERYRRKK